MLSREWRMHVINFRVALRLAVVRARVCDSLGKSGLLIEIYRHPARRAPYISHGYAELFGTSVHRVPGVFSTLQSCGPSCTGVEYAIAFKINHTAALHLLKVGLLLYCEGKCHLSF